MSLFPYLRDIAAHPCLFYTFTRKASVQSGILLVALVILKAWRGKGLGGK